MRGITFKSEIINRESTVRLRVSFREARWAHYFFLPTLGPRYVKDKFLCSKFVITRTNRTFRVNRLLETRTYSAEFLNKQPISRLTNIMNQFSDFVVVKLYN